MKSARFVIAWMLVLILIVPAEARERTPLEQARKIAIGSRVLVQMKNRQAPAVEGRLGTITETQFTLEPLTPGPESSVELLFQDVAKIRSIEPTKKEALLKPLQVLVLIPLFVLCGIGAIFHRDCDL